MILNKGIANQTAIELLEPSPYRITDYKQELDDTFTLTLMPVDSSKVFHFQPGQFNMIYVFGAGEAPLSISSSSEDNGSIIHTIKAVGRVTKLLQASSVGDVVGVRGPFGRGWPLQELIKRDLLIIAGGLGLAPLRPLIYYIAAHRDNFGKVALLIGSRSPERVLFREQLRQWREESDIDVQITVDYKDSTTDNDSYWSESTGPVTNLIAHSTMAPENTTALMCGPEIMMWYGAMALEKRGIAKRNIYLSMERNMRCALGLCGHCQWGPHFICKDGPVLCYADNDIETYMTVRGV